MDNTHTEIKAGLSQRLGDIADRFTEEIEQGRAPDIEGYLAEHADLSHVLRPLLTALAEIETGGLEELADGTGGQKVLGDFRIVREIGRGGMGIVYEAEQKSMGRMVALKVLPFASMIDPKPLERFRNEVRAVGTLQHPHIVPVYSVGEERGVHYYAMQLIRGQSLAVVIKELQAMRRADGALSGSSISEIIARCSTDGNEPSGDELTTDDGSQKNSPAPSNPETRGQADSGTVKSATDRNYYSNVARLGIQAAEALSHAHEHGIVHRDIKPGNLMLDAHGQLFVTDFGLAQIEAAGVTMTGDWLGTPRYMSPEQTLGQPVMIDHRADIYSLGVTLYELLTLRPAFDADDRKELLRQIANDEPARPRAIDSHIPRELETIVLKTISKNRDERYDTAAELADDLRCFLEDKPIKAKPPTLMQRANKYMRRHQTLVTVCAAFLVLATVGLAVSTLLIIQQSNARDRARNEAVENLQIANDAVDKFMTRVATEKLLNTPHMEQLKRELLEDAIGFYQRMAESESAQYPLRLAAATAYVRLGEIHNQLGNRETSSQALAQAVKALRQLHHEFPEQVQCTVALADALFHRSTSLRKRSWTPEDTVNRDAGEKACREAIDLLEKLAKAHPKRTAFQIKLIDARLELVTWFDDSEGPLNRLEALATGVMDCDPSNAESRFAYARVLEALARLPFGVGGLKNPIDASARSWEWKRKTVTELDRKRFEKSIAILRSLVIEHPDIAKYREHLGLVCWNKLNHFTPQHREDRVKEWQSVVTIYQRLVADFPRTPEYLNKLGGARMALGAAYVNDKKIVDPENSLAAEKQYREAVSIRLKLLQDNPGFEDYLFGLDNVYLNMCKLHAKSMNHKGLLEANLGRLSVAESLEQNYERKGDTDQATQMRRALGSLRFLNAEHLTALRRYDEAIEVAEEADRLLNLMITEATHNESVGLSSPQWCHRSELEDMLADYRGMFSEQLFAGDYTEESRDYAVRALELLRAAVKHNPGCPEPKANLAYWMVTLPHEGITDPQEALDLVASSLAEQEGTASDTVLTSAWLVKGLAHLRLGHWSEAIDVVEKCVELRDDNDVQPGRYAIESLILAIASWHLERRDESHRWLERADNWRESTNYLDDRNLLWKLDRLHDEAEKLIGSVGDVEK